MNKPQHLPQGVYSYATPYALIEAIFGPMNHDAHVVAWCRHQFRIERNEWLDRAEANVRAETAKIIAEFRAERARINGALHQGELLEAAE